jgi:hypothetical protein
MQIGGATSVCEPSTPARRSHSQHKCASWRLTRAPGGPKAAPNSAHVYIVYYVLLKSIAETISLVGFIYLFNFCGITGGRDRPSEAGRASAPVDARRDGVPAAICSCLLLPFPEGLCCAAEVSRIRFGRRRRMARRNVWNGHALGGNILSRCQT